MRIQIRDKHNLFKAERAKTDSNKTVIDITAKAFLMCKHTNTPKGAFRLLLGCSLN